LFEKSHSFMDDTNWLSKLICFLKILVQGVWINRFQLFLTTVTMTIGSFGLALTIFLGDGALDVLWADIENLLGSWTIVSPTAGPQGELLLKRSTYFFTQEDLDGLKREVVSARMVTPAILDMHVRVRTEKKEENVQLDAVTKILGNEDIFKPIAGRKLSDEAYAGLVRECLITDTMAEKHNIRADEGATILINGVLFDVVGIVNTPPLRGDSFPQRIVVSYTTARTLWIEPGNIGIFVVAWKTTEDMYDTLGQIKYVLDGIRGAQTYVMSSQQFQIQSGRKIVKTFIVVGTTQSIFCILIASIGVLNVMLTNVSRRTHEFAIRVVMGARQREILMVVLAESICIGLLGAFAGLVVAVVAAPAVAGLMSEGIAEAAQLQPDISFRGILIPVLICGLCSLVAGVIPALKLRKIDILAALRANV